MILYQLEFQSWEFLVSLAVPLGHPAIKKLVYKIPEYNDIFAECPWQVLRQQVASAL
jgi:hypothetical protein